MIAAGRRSDIGPCLAILRLARGWTQGTVAELAGLDSSAISDYERGKVDPKHSTVRRILRALGAPYHLLDQTHDYLILARATMGAEPETPHAVADSGGVPLPQLPAAIAAEIGAVAGEAARATARTTRLQLSLLALAAQGQALPRS